MRLRACRAAAFAAVVLAGCAASNADRPDRDDRAAQRPRVEVALPVSAMAGGQSSPIAPYYGARVAGAIRSHLLPPPEAASLVGNPAVQFDVHAAPDGSITAIALRQTSGSPAWDQAAFRALSKTEILPPDDAGVVPPRLFITLRPRQR